MSTPTTPEFYEPGQRLTREQLRSLDAFPIGATPVAGTIRKVEANRFGIVLVVTLDAGSGMAYDETTVYG